MRRAHPLLRSCANAGVLIIIALVARPLPAEDSAPQRPWRFIYNCDANNMFIYKKPPMTPEDIHDHVDRVAASGVTTFFMSPNNGMVMNFRSRHARMLGDEGNPEIRRRIVEEGMAKSGTNARAALNFQGLADAGHDPLGLVLQRAKDKGMESFVSFRLNEVHGVDTPDDFPQLMIISRCWREHPEWHIGKPGSTLSALHQQIMGPRTSPIVGRWLPGGLDFSFPQVRERRIAQLRECCERYDIDGLDLDFQRFPAYFMYGEEGRHLPTMTAWVRQVREMTHEVGARRGRPLLLCARIMARPEQNLALGLDPVTWVRDGLVDFVTVSHYLRNDFTLPVSEYRRLLPEKAPIYASIEYEPEAETYRRLARELHEQGVDGLMVFNYFARRESGGRIDFDLLAELASRHASEGP